MAEEIHYKVVEKLGNDIEIRHYNKQLWAADHNSDSNLSFMKLLAYIEGENKEQKKIGMTVPVINSEDVHGPYIAFVLPKEIMQPPEPLDREIKIMHVLERKLAVIALTGLVTPESFERDKRILEKTLKNKEAKIKTGPYFLQYNKPWTAPLEQRNEIAYEIV